MQLAVDVRNHPATALEGDEILTVDAAYAIQGTGTEDLFNGHFYFWGGLRSHALHGLTSGGSDNPSPVRPKVHAHRFWGPDVVPFASRLHFELENGGPPGTAEDYRAVAFYYLQH
jgi:hypothetical protein